MNGHDFRIFYEKYGLFKLAEHLGVKEEKIRHLTKTFATSDYDLDFVGIKFDVKYASPTLTSKIKKVPIWDFDLRKNEKHKKKVLDRKHCDFYLCIGMKNGIPKSIFLVPYDKAPKHHLRISVIGSSKWYKYKI